MSKKSRHSPNSDGGWDSKKSGRRASKHFDTKKAKITVETLPGKNQAIHPWKSKSKKIPTETIHFHQKG